MRCKILVASLLMISTHAFAGDLTLSGGWFRALPAGLPAGGYFTLTNNGAKDAVLTGAESPSCGMLMLHKSENSGGMSMMDMVSSVTVPAHGSLTFAPGAYHLMCMQPSAEMSPGGSVGVTLKFADGSKLDGTFAVKSARGQ